MYTLLSFSEVKEIRVGEVIKFVHAEKVLESRTIYIEGHDGQVQTLQVISAPDQPLSLSVQ